MEDKTKTIYRCPTLECYSTDVLKLAWVKPNKNNEFDSFEDSQEYQSLGYCNRCKEHVELEIFDYNSETYADLEAFKNFMITVIYRDIDLAYANNELEYNLNLIGKTVKQYPVIFSVAKVSTKLYFLRYINQLKDLITDIDYYRYLNEKRVHYLYDGVNIKNLQEDTVAKMVQDLIDKRNHD